MKSLTEGLRLDHLLHPFEGHADQPFTAEECRELLNLLKTLEGMMVDTIYDYISHEIVYSAQSIGPLQTHIVAKIHVRLAKHRHHRLVSSSIVHDIFHKKKQTEPFSNFFVRVFFVFFCFGIPFKYVARTEGHSAEMEGHPHKHPELSATDGRLFADSAASAATVALLVRMHRVVRRGFLD